MMSMPSLDVKARVVVAVFIHSPYVYSTFSVCLLLCVILQHDRPAVLAICRSMSRSGMPSGGARLQFVKQEASGALDIIDQILWPFSCVRQETHCTNSTQALEVHGTIVHNTYVVKEKFVWKRCVMRPVKLRETD